MNKTVVEQLQEALSKYTVDLLESEKWTFSAIIEKKWDTPYVPYKIVAPFMTRENLAELCTQEISRVIFEKLSRELLKSEDRYMFWEDILSAVDIVPRKWRAQICLDCIRSGTRRIPRERDGSLLHSSSHDYKQEGGQGYVGCSKWLVDAAWVRKWYCSLNKPGHKELACIDIEHQKNWFVSKSLESLIAKDNLPMFALTLDIAGGKVNWGLFFEAFRCGADKIFDWLVENYEQWPAAIKPFYLMVHCIVNLPPEQSLKAIECVERHCPGTASQCDALGNNLLWYSLHNDHNRNSEGLVKLLRFLFRCGCSIHTQNHLGLSYGDMCKVLIPIG